jgi:hypothetical protein
MYGWKRYGEDDPAEVFSRLPVGGTMKVDQRGMKAVCSRNRLTSVYREVDGEPGMFEVMKVGVPKKKTATLEERIMKVVSERGGITMGVLVNLLRIFPSEDVQREARRMVAAGKLRGFQRAHKYNKKMIQYVSRANDEGAP